MWVRGRGGRSGVWRIEGKLLKDKIRDGDFGNGRFSVGDPESTIRTRYVSGCSCMFCRVRPCVASCPAGSWGDASFPDSQLNLSSSFWKSSTSLRFHRLVRQPRALRLGTRQFMGAASLKCVVEGTVERQVPEGCRTVVQCPACRHPVESPFATPLRGGTRGPSARFTFLVSSSSLFSSLFDLGFPSMPCLWEAVSHPSL